MGAERCAGAGAEGWGRGAAHRARRARPSDAVVVEERRPSPTSRRGRATTPLTPAAAHARSTRPSEAGCRPSRSSGDRRPQSSSRTAARPRRRYWAPWRPSSRARTARGRATAQHDVKGVGRCNSQRAQQREYREQHGHHPAPSASALRRGGARQPDIGSRSLAVQPGSWVGPLGADCRRTCPNLHRSAPPVHPLNDAWGDTVPGNPTRRTPVPIQPLFNLPESFERLPLEGAAKT